MVILFCILLILGIALGQIIDVSHSRDALALITSMCLSYIMIEVGLEFTVDKRDVKSYAWDSIVSFFAAIIPAFLWFGYFLFILQSPWKPAVLSGLSCAPTSAGVLFSMMLAAGLGATWVFKKARILAVLDDLATILLLTPLQILIGGFDLGSLILLFLISIFIYASFRWQNSIFLPLGEKWLLVYAVILTFMVFFVKRHAHIHLEVLIPAFMWGCLIHHKKIIHVQPSKSKFLSLDTVIKGSFMFLVGFSFPKVSIESIPITVTMGHVFMLTLLSNLGKCFPMLCYRKEVGLRERLALSVTMFPRGEVGAAVLLIGLGYGFSGYITTLAMLSLAFNLVLTGIFVWIVMRLLDVKK